MDPMLATDNWCIKVSEKVYGPYTQDQMAAFAGEGRLSLRSVVSPAGGKMWREARQFPPLAALFDGTKKSEKAFGKSSSVKANHKVPDDGEASNFLVVFDVVAGSAGRVEPALRSLGTAFRITDNVWLLTSTQSALGIKNTLTPHLNVREPVFVVDCSRGRTSWQNFVPELHARLAKAWIAVQA
jgi:hypothetical protein